MKKILLIIAIFLAPLIMKAQQNIYTNDPTLLEEITGLIKKSDKFNLYLNMHTSLNAKWIEHHGFDHAYFKMDQLRIEARGNLNSWMYYRWRQRLNRSNDGGGALDNLPKSIDYAAVGFRPSSKFSIFIGKQCAAYGGFEFDLNPIEIYEYSDMVEYMDNFLTGVNFIYNISSSQELCLQILDSRNYSFERTYGNLPSYVRDTKCPLLYTLNWNGSFLEDMLKFRWSASLMQEARSQNMAYFAAGNEINIDKVNAFVDVMYARQGIDRKGIITEIINSDLGNRTDYTALGADYLSVVAKLNYRFEPRWNFFVKGMYETAGLYKHNEDRAKGRYRTSWGYLAGIEYYPTKTNLHFFLTFIGRTYDYNFRGKELGWRNYNTQQITTGFIYQLPMF